MIRRHFIITLFCGLCFVSVQGLLAEDLVPKSEELVPKEDTKSEEKSKTEEEKTDAKTGETEEITEGKEGSGPYGFRQKRTLGTSAMYPTAKTEKAVAAGLQWLDRHQSLDKTTVSGKEAGLWFEYAWASECQDYQGPGKGGQNSDADKFPGHCGLGVGGSGEDDKPREGYTVGISGIAILSYAGAGYSHRQGDHKKSVQRWLNIICATLDESRKADKPGAFCQIPKTIENGVKKPSANDQSQWMDMPVIIMAKKKVAGTSWESISTAGDGIANNTGTQKPMYQHGVLTLALNEVYGVSQDNSLKKYCVDATHALLAARCAGNGLWQYQYSKVDWNTYGGGRGEAESNYGDLSSGTWAIMALKAAKETQILPDAAKRVGTTEDQVMKDLKDAIAAMHPGPAIDDRSGPGKDEAGFYYDKGYSQRAIGMPPGMADIAFIYTGKEMLAQMKPFAEKMSKSLCLDDADPIAACQKDRYCMGLNYWGEKKDAAPCSDESRARYYYNMYYTTLALFQYGGDIWKKYNKMNMEWLVKNQRQGKKSCDDGSWEPDRTCNNSAGRTWTACQSRVFGTALNVLQLQVYYRYKRNADAK